MAANRINYLVLYTSDSQVFGSGSKDVALESPLPEGVSIESKRVFSVTYHPDTGELIVHKVPQDIVMNAVPKERKVKKAKDEETTSDPEA